MLAVWVWIALAKATGVLTALLLLVVALRCLDVCRWWLQGLIRAGTLLHLRGVLSSVVSSCLLHAATAMPAACNV